jgi:glycosyltransferase involved in cell wall biosynthesis
VVYEYLKPVSIVHYFKQIEVLNLDYILVLSKPTDYNVRSENVSRFLEGGIFGVPCIAPLQYPYSLVIKDFVNGYLYTKDALVEKVKAVLSNSRIADIVKNNLVEDIEANHSFNEKVNEDILNAFNY